MWRNKIKFKGNGILFGFSDSENASAFDAILALPHAAQYDFFGLKSQGAAFLAHLKIAIPIAYGVTLSSPS